MPFEEIEAQQSAAVQGEAKGGEAKGSKAKGSEAKESKYQFLQVRTDRLKYFFIDTQSLPEGFKIFYRGDGEYWALKAKPNGYETRFEQVDDLGEMVQIQNGMDNWYEKYDEAAKAKRKHIIGEEKFAQEEKKATLQGLLEEKKRIKELMKAMQDEEGDESSSRSSTLKASRSSTMKADAAEDDDDDEDQK